MRWVIRVGLVLALASPVAASLVAYRWLEARAVPLAESPLPQGSHLSSSRSGISQGSEVRTSQRDPRSGRRWPGFLSADVGALRDFTGPPLPVVGAWPLLKHWRT
jgi:hypothetical protein